MICPHILKRDAPRNCQLDTAALSPDLPAPDSRATLVFSSRAPLDKSGVSLNEIKDVGNVQQIVDIFHSK